MSLFFAAILFSIVCSCSTAYEHPAELEKELDYIDTILEDREVIEIRKDHRIKLIKEKMYSDSSLLSLYRKYDWLADEYRQYRVDSAMFYSKKALAVATEMGDERYYNDAVLDMAERYIVSGMYHDAEQLLLKIDTTETSCMDYPLYYFRMRALNEGLALISDDTTLVGVYKSREAYYLNRIISVIDTNDVRYTYIESELLMNSGKIDEALVLLEQKYNQADLPVNEKAIITHLIGQCYMQQGKLPEASVFFARSAGLDLLTPVYSYRSLCYLSVLLYKAGDLNRAYKYMIRSIEDARLSHTRLSIEVINDMFPVISETYDYKMRENNERMVLLLVALGLSLLVMVIALISLSQEKKRVQAAEKKTAEINRKLLELNERLEEYVKQLKDSNNIKELYLGRYLDMCSDYIEAISRYRSEIRAIAKKGSLTEVQAALRSNDFIEEELDKFYVTFDRTFLDLFPNFITRLNELLQEDKQIPVSSKDGILTTELRIMALLRLGVTDSVKISEFLRRSPSTIYNYRVKMRNSARGDRDAFENKVMEIE